MEIHQGWPVGASAWIALTTVINIEESLKKLKMFWTEMLNEDSFSLQALQEAGRTENRYLLIYEKVKFN